MLITFWFFGTLTFEEVFHEALFMGPAAATAATAITFFLFVGAAGKSAQIPLFVWLPDAMAGPTPVSALIHAATMVTAGIYMLVRNAPLLELATTTPDIIALIGAAHRAVGGQHCGGQIRHQARARLFHHQSIGFHDCCGGDRSLRSGHLPSSGACVL